MKTALTATLIAVAFVACKDPAPGNPALPLNEPAAAAVAKIQEPPPAPVQVSRGRIDIGKISKSFDYAKVLVAYTNDGPQTFTSLVEIQCVARTKDGAPIGESKRSFFADERGPIGPGFTGTLTIPVEVGKDVPKDVRCEIVSAE